jgi:murein tripeptide amidase MpaA
MKRLLAGLFLAVANSARVAYTGQQIIRCSFTDASVISKMEETLDVWGVRPDQTVDVRVKTPAERAYVETITNGCENVVQDLEADVAKFEAENLAARNKADADWFDAYHNYDELTAWYRNFTTQHSRLATWVDSIGTTSGGRRLFAVRLTLNAAGVRKRHYWQCQIHAREWISGATCNYIVNQIAQDQSDSFWSNFLLTNEIIVVPQVNPDGIQYTWSNDRLWRKNRRNNSGSNCYGVDNNRNYNNNWGGGGSSGDPCSDTYRGPSNASEPETQATSNYFNSLKSTPIHSAIDWHSYSQLVLRPYGNNNSLCPDETKIKTAGDGISSTIRATTGFAYTSQRSYQLYQTTGSASDWFYGTGGWTGNGNVRVYSLTIELRPANANQGGFELPPSQIKACGNENYQGMRYFLNQVNNNPLP